MQRAREDAANRLARAVTGWRRLLGAGRVLFGRETLGYYGRTNLGRGPLPLAIVRPGKVGQIPGVLRVASAEGIALYPISRGRNWGWGEACPVTPGQAILDLAGLDRILEINAELGYAIVEPGVTQGQLAAALSKRAP